jgi:hypothetical protein
MKKKDERGKGTKAAKSSGMGLEKKLITYSVAAGAALAMAQTSDALIHYSGPQSITVDQANPSYSLSLDGAAGKGFVFLHWQGTRSGGRYSWRDNRLKPAASTAQWLQSISGYPANLPLGAIVSGSARSGFVTFDQPLNGTYVQSVTNLKHLGAFFNSNGFLGVKFHHNGKPVYGWIEYEGNGGHSGTIKGWAYEDSGAAIKAGQAEESYVVPTFTELGLLLFAAVLLYAGTRGRRKSADDLS